METILEIKGLSKIYKKHRAVDNANMTIRRGDIYGFVGENGAGKTTMIRMITGLVEPSKGNFTLFNSNNKSAEILDARKRISAVVETPSIALNMTAVENLKLQACIIGLTDYSFIDKVMEITGIAYLKSSKKKAKNFSLGMKQRLGIAIALLGHPDLVILDEPMNGLDPEGIVEFRELIIKLNKEHNITFLISSHILDELSKVATKYGFLSHGTMVAELSKEELEAKCQKCLELELSSDEKASIVIEEELKHLEYKIFDENFVRLYGDVNISKVVEALNKAGVGIKSINTKNEGIEEFYLNIIKNGKMVKRYV